MPTTRYIERPSWWYEPDPEPYTDTEAEEGWEAYIEEYGEEPDLNSRKWEKFFEDWLDSIRNPELYYD